jgi:hypothetical protein
LAHGVERNALHQTFGVDVRVKRLSIVKANSLRRGCASSIWSRHCDSVADFGAVELVTLGATGNQFW